MSESVEAAIEFGKPSGSSSSIGAGRSSRCCFSKRQRHERALDAAGSRVPDAEPALTESVSESTFCYQVRRLADGLYGKALRLTRDSENARDLVSETLAKAWTRRGQLVDHHCFEKWIHRILVNTFVSQWRRTRADPLRTFAEHGTRGEVPPADAAHRPPVPGWSDPERALTTALFRHDLERALAELPGEYRIAALLVDVRGYSYREAAGILQVPLGTVRSRLSRARSLLRRALWCHAREAGMVD